MSSSGRRGEQAWLRGYDANGFPPFALTVDLAIFTIREGLLCALLIQRGEHPYRGWWALPGGHVRQGYESADQAAARELAEETGIDPTTTGAHLEQLATYTEPRRDPRIRAGLHVASVGYFALAPNLQDPAPGSDAAQARWWPVEDLDLAEQRECWLSDAPFEGDEPALAFDHAVILADALERVRAKMEYSTLATQFVTEPFSLADLRRVYVAVWGQSPDLANFRRKVLQTPGFVVPAKGDGTKPKGAGRPPTLYLRGSATHVNPPITR